MRTPSVDSRCITFEIPSSEKEASDPRTPQAPIDVPLSWTRRKELLCIVASWIDPLDLQLIVVSPVPMPGSEANEGPTMSLCPLYQRPVLLGQMGIVASWESQGTLVL